MHVIMHCMGHNSMYKVYIQQQGGSENDQSLIRHLFAEDDVEQTGDFHLPFAANRSYYRDPNVLLHPISEASAVTPPANGGAQKVPAQGHKSRCRFNKISHLGHGNPLYPRTTSDWEIYFHTVFRWSLSDSMTGLTFQQ